MGKYVYLYANVFAMKRRPDKLSEEIAVDQQDRCMENGLGSPSS